MWTFLDGAGESLGFECPTMPILGHEVEYESCNALFERPESRVGPMASRGICPPVPAPQAIRAAAEFPQEGAVLRSRGW